MLLPLLHHAQRALCRALAVNPPLLVDALFSSAPCIEAIIVVRRILQAAPWWS
jgi:hypothetical protein